MLITLNVINVGPVKDVTTLSTFDSSFVMQVFGRSMRFRYKNN